MKQPLLNYKLNENNEMGVLFLTSASKDIMARKTKQTTPQISLLAYKMTCFLLRHGRRHKIKAFLLLWIHFFVLRVQAGVDIHIAGAGGSVALTLRMRAAMLRNSAGVGGASRALVWGSMICGFSQGQPGGQMRVNRGHFILCFEERLGWQDVEDFSVMGLVWTDSSWRWCWSVCCCAGVGDGGWCHGRYRRTCLLSGGNQAKHLNSFSYKT